jgi:GT2 family glycosyltransferase
LKGFDEDYFLYAEETDLCLRIRKAGYKIGYCDQVTVKHVGSASERGNPPVEIIRKKKLGKYLFYRKHYPRTAVVKIAKNEMGAARRKLFPLNLKKLVFKLNQSQLEDHARYSASYSIAKQLLTTLK